MNCMSPDGRQKGADDRKEEAAYCVARSLRGLSRGYAVPDRSGAQD